MDLSYSQKEWVYCSLHFSSTLIHSVSKKAYGRCFKFMLEAVEHHFKTRYAVEAENKEDLDTEIQ